VICPSSGKSLIDIGLSVALNGRSRAANLFYVKSNLMSSHRLVLAVEPVEPKSHIFIFPKVRRRPWSGPILRDAA
jgi:hypothetical protein